MSRLLPLVLLSLAACASPSAEYFGVEPQRVTIGGRDYVVYQRRAGSTVRAQVIRMGWAGLRDHAPILEAMVQAAEQVSGCAAVRAGISGDSGVLNLTLRCPAGG
jgi:hypothetical protein